MAAFGAGALFVALKKQNFSFDIFDTTVTRMTAHPRAVFSVLAVEIVRSRYQIPNELSANFSQERISAERLARKVSKTEDVSIEQIYEVIKQKFELTDDVINQLIGAEVKIESEIIRIIPETAQLISDLREQGVRIIYVSDMYLPTDVIRKILVEKGLFLDGDGLYVSGQLGLRKKTGRLFRHVLHVENLKPSQILHVGDHRRNDYVMARLNGIEALYLKRGRLNPYEQILTACPSDDPGWMTGQFLGGAARLARLEAYRQPTERWRTLHEIGSDVVGPVLLQFVYWLFHEATKDKIKTLYFLARDGQVMMQAAAMIAKKLDISIDLKYLYVSRQSLFVSLFSNLTKTEISWILNKDPILNIALVARRLSLDESFFQRYLEAAGFPRIELQDDLTPVLCERLRQLLLYDVDLRSQIDAVASTARKNILGYLRQEGLCDSRSWAVVDSGWTGRLQHAIDEILVGGGFCSQTNGFYFGIFEQHNLRGHKKGYLFSRHQDKYFKWCRPFTFLFETMTAAPHGTTLAYEKLTSGEYRPVLDNRQIGVDPDEIRALREGVFEFIKTLELENIIYDEYLFRERAFRLLRRFYLKPSKAEAEFFGALKYSNDQTDSSPFELAQVMSFLDCCKFTINMMKKKKYAQTYWLNGSRVRSQFIVKPYLYILEFVHFNLNSVYAKYLGMKSKSKF